VDVGFRSVSGDVGLPHASLRREAKY